MTWEDIQNFKPSEFDSPDYKGSGRMFMHLDFVKKLDIARLIAGVPFIITSGYRTKSYNSTLRNASSNSSHIKGLAADIAVTSNNNRRVILNALFLVGLNRRLGIGDTFIHVDDDLDKSESIWLYDNPLVRNNTKNNKTEDL